VKAILDGQHPPAYCIVVNFKQFRGFLVGSKRRFLFVNHHGVPLYRQKCLPQTIPGWIRKKQSLALCYREFPIDLSRHVTAHRGQGKTWKNRLLFVDLGLETPNSHIPSDIGSVIYVACTRTDTLRNLFITPIFPSIWERTGKSAQDEARRNSEDKLKKDAAEFAATHGWHQEFVQKQSFVPDYLENGDEWNEILVAKHIPRLDDNVIALDQAEEMSTEQRSVSNAAESEVLSWLTPYGSERHIGIDQGVRNFANVAVDKMPNSLLKL